MAHEPNSRPGIWHAIALVLGLLLVLPGLCSLAILGTSVVDGTVTRDFTGPYSEIFIVIWTGSLAIGIAGSLLTFWAARRLRTK